ncbi:MAG: FGGY-family carbohydrate kinase [Gemmataceae bacterium]|nr:FGGY-family carbohydrate kinase [Gemmataceae bacterium]
MHILALDIGTSSVKAAVLDQATGDPVVHPAKAPYDLDHPTPDAAEVPAERVWEAVGHAAKEAVAAAKGVTVEGVGMSCLTPALVLLGADDEVLSPVWTHLDRRSRPVARETWAKFGAEFLNDIGTRPLPGGISAVGFAQQVRDTPGLKARVRRYLHLSGWLGLRMSGAAALDPANASFSGVYGTCTDHRWSARWCGAFGVDPGWLPPVVDGRDALGGLRADVAGAWGLTPGTPVKVGTADTSCAMLAARLGPGDILHSVGTTQVLAVVTDKPAPDPRRLTRRYGVGDKYAVVTHNPVGGAALEWMHNLCFHDQPADLFYGKTVFACDGRDTDVTLDPPYLGGDRLEIEPRLAHFTHLSTDDTREDLLAAVLEAMRRGHRAALAGLGVDPSAVRRVVLTGGGAEVVRRVLPEYRDGGVRVEEVEELSLRGVARLWDPG